MIINVWPTGMYANLVFQSFITEPIEDIELPAAILQNQGQPPKCVLNELEVRKVLSTCSLYASAGLHLGEGVRDWAPIDYPPPPPFNLFTVKVNPFAVTNAKWRLRNTFTGGQRRRSALSRSCPSFFSLLFSELLENAARKEKLMQYEHTWKKLQVTGLVVITKTMFMRVTLTLTTRK